MREYTPTTEEVRGWATYLLEETTPPHIVEKYGAEFDRWLAAAKAEAWDEGHLHYQKRGPDNCACFAHYEGECACGEFGNGVVVSLSENPYREASE
jgi:hypothetical protein